MGRDIGGHTHGDTGGTVHQQGGHPGRQHCRLFERSIKIGHEIHGILVQVYQEFTSQARQPRFCVTHGGGGIGVNRTEVALPVHQHITQGKALGHTHHGVVDRTVAVGMIFTEHIADDAGAFLVRRIVMHPQFIHGIKDAAVHRFQAVPNIGQGAGNNNAHSVIKVGVFHLHLNIYRANFTYDHA